MDRYAWSWQEENFSSADFIDENRAETAIEILHREREERIRKRKLEKEKQGTVKKIAQTVSTNEYKPQMRTVSTNECKPQTRTLLLPHGWLNCPAIGDCINDLIIPSKVPLDESYNDNVPPGKRYSPKNIIEKQRKIGLVIDLTNTTRYYSAREWTNHGIKYQKIACKGRDEVPDNESVNQFVHEVMKFKNEQRNANRKKYILVHCTHGHNRTGFMIVHYLVRKQFSSVSEALEAFKKSRDPGIYKRDYIEALYKFYHQIPGKNSSCPSTPEWKKSPDHNQQSVQDDDNDDLSDSSIILLENGESSNNNITNDDILGDPIPYQQQEELRKLCYKLMELTYVHNGKRNKLQFPGSHPVSLNKNNLQYLAQRYYHATWKADGTRYMLLIMRHGCYLIDRNFTFRRFQMRFPLKNKSNDFHDMSLIDGEMIIDKVEENGCLNLQRRYLAYDLMAINGVSRVKFPFFERWKLLEDEIIKPHNNDDNELFRIKRKGFWLLSTVEKLLTDFIPKLSHQSDGLIFQGWDEPYVCRTDDGLLKWKYPEMNSVDFLFESGSLFLYERGKKKQMDEECIIKFQENEETDSKSGKIIECAKDPAEDNSWVFMRVRYDKATPNEYNTYKKVLKSIKDNITQDFLVSITNEFIELPMYQDRMPRQQPQPKRP